MCFGVLIRGVFWGIDKWGLFGGNDNYGVFWGIDKGCVLGY